MSLQYWCAACGKNTTETTLCPDHPGSDQFELEIEACRNCKHYEKIDGKPCPDHAPKCVHAGYVEPRQVA